MHRILVADDVRLFRDLERSFLEGHGYHCLTAADGAECLQMARTERPDLVFLDLYMPRMNGEECCRAIKGDPQLKRIPVVVITSAYRPAEMDRVKAAGADAILQKPLQRAEALDLLQRLLGRAVEPAPSLSDDPRVRALEEENRSFAQRLVELEEENAVLANLYVASSQIHASLDLQEVLRAIQEILINLVGAETFALVLEDEGGHLQVLAGEGVTPGAPIPAEEVVRRVVQGGEAWMPSEDEDAGAPALACFPLRIARPGEAPRAIGAIALYRLLQQKRKLQDLDRRIFTFLGDHAAAAILASRLYGQAQRKIKTIEGLMGLLTRRS